MDNENGSPTIGFWVGIVVIIFLAALVGHFTYVFITSLL